MFGISGSELLIIAVFVLVIFGPDKLPELARMFGRAMNTFKQAQEDMERVIRAEVYAPDKREKDTEAPVEAEVKERAARSAAAVWAATEEDEEEDEE